MKPEELSLIESKLGIELPRAYKQAVSPYPIDALRGNTDWMLWDDAQQLIALNQRLREGEKSITPWPKRFFATGEDGGGCSDAIDLEDPEFGVFWFDRQHIDVGGSDRSPEKLREWVTRQITDSKDDLEANGIDPSVTPDQKNATDERNNLLGSAPLLIGALVLGLAICCWILFVSGSTN